MAQLASVIAQINDGDGPDLLGVCEVENRFVLDLLAGALADRPLGRQYSIVHADTGDARGIDVAFLYDPGLLEAPADEVCAHLRTATRIRTLDHPEPDAPSSSTATARNLAGGCRPVNIAGR